MELTLSTRNFDSDTPEILKIPAAFKECFLCTVTVVRFACTKKQRNLDFQDANNFVTWNGQMVSTSHSRVPVRDSNH